MNCPLALTFFGERCTDTVPESSHPTGCSIWVVALDMPCKLICMLVRLSNGLRFLSPVPAARVPV